MNNNNKMKERLIIKEPDYMGENRRGFKKLCFLFFMLAGLLMLSISFESWALGGSGMTLGAGIGVAKESEVIVAETPTTTNVDKASPDLLIEAVLKKVIQTHPSSFPLDTLLSYMPTQSTPSWEYRAYDTPYLPYTGTVKTATTATGVAGAAVEISPGNVEHIRNNSCLFIPAVSGSATTDGKYLALYVQGITRGSNPVVYAIPLNATNGKVGIIPAGTKYIIGPIAAHELDMQVESQVPIPQSYENYNQLFMCQMELGDFAAAHLKEVGWNWNDIQDYTIMDFRLRRTISYYFGFAAKFIDSIKNVEKYSTGGIERQITRRYTQPTTWSDALFIDFSKFVFVGAKGSRRKVLLAGDELIANISKTPNIQKNQPATSTEVVYGLTFSKIKTNFGDLLVHYDPLFTEMGLPTKGVVLDPEFIVRTNFNGISYDKLDPKGAGWKRAKIESIAEASSALLRNRDTHVWID